MKPKPGQIPFKVTLRDVDNPSTRGAVLVASDTFTNAARAGLGRVRRQARGGPRRYRFAVASVERL